MFGTLKGRLLVIALVVAGAAAVLFTRPITLGLDLQGGMYLALEVQDPEGTMTPEVRRAHTEQNEHILRNRIDQFGVAEPTVQRVGDYRIIVELPGIDDEERARQVIERQAFLELKLLREGTPLMQALPRMDRAVVAALGPEGLAALGHSDEPVAADTTRQLQQDVRDRLFGRADTAAADTAASDTTAVAEEDTVTTPATPSSRPLSALLNESGGEGELLVLEQDVARVNQMLALPGVREALPRGSELIWDARTRGAGAQLYRSLYFVTAEPFLTGERLEDAQAGRDQQFGQTIVSFQLDRRGGRDFERVTGANIGRRIAIVLDGQIHSAPEIRTRIGANGQIDMGQAPMEEARDLALVLRAGAFSAPLEIVEQRSVGPSLGQDSIDQGRLAGIIGISLVILVMIVYYRFAGFLAISALVIYVLLLMAGLAGLGATLTAPGIAGIILSLGMAVDANVLIFERIREELVAGRTVRQAVDNGFGHAMSAIVDSNITTLITALILFQIGTGPVRGFAVTLSIGIVASFFTAVFITRSFMMAYLERRRTADAISI
ncbi:MAG TPA: protein translocase subunit SecD [Longimicrobiales bacterium]|nr:protein translocase subunit SecD [Longimicrobiales bacterium]